MSKSDADRRNDQYGWIDSLAPDLLRASRELVESGEASRVSDEVRRANSDSRHSPLRCEV